MMKVVVAILAAFVVIFLLYFLFKPRKSAVNSVSRQASPRKKTSVKRFDHEKKDELVADDALEYDVLGLKIDQSKKINQTNKADKIENAKQTDKVEGSHARKVIDSESSCEPEDVCSDELAKNNHAQALDETRDLDVPKEGVSQSAVKIPSHVIHHILPVDQPFFSGHELLQNLIACGFKFGKHAIFDYPGSKNSAPLFSLAQSENPGTFDIERIANCRCRGLALFFSPSQVKNPVLSYEELLQNANVLVEALGGRLVNEKIADLSSDESDAIRMSMIQAMSLGLNRAQPEKV